VGRKWVFSTLAIIIIGVIVIATFVIATFVSVTLYGRLSHQGSV